MDPFHRPTTTYPPYPPAMPQHQHYGHHPLTYPPPPLQGNTAQPIEESKGGGLKYAVIALIGIISAVFSWNSYTTFFSLLNGKDSLVSVVLPFLLFSLFLGIYLAATLILALLTEEHPSKFVVYTFLVSCTSLLIPSFSPIIHGFIFMLIFLGMIVSFYFTRSAQELFISFKPLHLVPRALPLFFLCFSLIVACTGVDRMQHLFAEGHSIQIPSFFKHELAMGTSRVAFGSILDIQSTTTIHNLAESLTRKITQGVVQDDSIAAWFFSSSDTITARQATVSEVEQNLLKSFQIETATPQTALVDVIGDVIEQRLQAMIAPFQSIVPYLIGALLFFFTKSITGLWSIATVILTSFLFQLLLSTNLLQKKQELKKTERLVL